MRRMPLAVLVSLLLALAASSSAQAFTLEPLGSAAAPIFLTSEPADPNRLYVVERAGTIRRLGAPGIFLDLTAAGLRRRGARPAVDGLRAGLRDVGPLLRLPHRSRRRPDRRRVPAGVGRERRSGQPARGPRDRALGRRPTTTAASSRSARTATCTSPPATAAAATTRSRTGRTSASCSARSCASTRGRRAARPMPSRPTTRSSARAAPRRRSGPTGCAIPGASRSTARPAT